MQPLDSAEKDIVRLRSQAELAKDSQAQAHSQREDVA